MDLLPEIDIISDHLKIQGHSQGPNFIKSFAMTFKDHESHDKCKLLINCMST